MTKTTQHPPNVRIETKAMDRRLYTKLDTSTLVVFIPVSPASRVVSARGPDSLTPQYSTHSEGRRVIFCFGAIFSHALLMYPAAVVATFTSSHCIRRKTTLVVTLSKLLVV